MNSADKSVKDKDGNNWLKSAAYTSPTIPLDDQLGVGGLDAWKSYQQYAAAEHGPGNVPLKGWDFFDDLPSLKSRYYSLDREILKGSWLTSTLVWDRQVTRDDKGTPDPSDDTFAYLGLDDLDLWLWWGSEKGKREEKFDLLSSYGFFDVTEHLHSLLPKTGWYTLEVDWWTNDSKLLYDDYALAWWTTSIPEPSTIILILIGIGVLLFIKRRRRRMNSLA